MGLIQQGTSKFINVTKSDTAPLEYNGEVMATKYISVGTAGILNIYDDNGTAVAIPANNLTVGVMYPIVTSHILATTTTAAEIVAYF